MIDYSLYLHLFLFIIFVYGLYELIRRYQFVGWIVFLLVPILFIGNIIESINDAPDAKLIIWSYAKFFSIIAAVCWIQACKYSKLGAKRWAYIVIYLFLALNMLEVSVQEFYHGIALNGLAVLLLILCIPSTKSMHIERTRKISDLSFDLPRLWFIGFTITNFVFCLNQITRVAGLTTGILIVALFVGLMKKEHWLQARAYTTAILLIAYLGFKPFFEPFWTYSWENKEIYPILGIITLVYVTLFVVIPRIYTLYLAYKQK